MIITRKHRIFNIINSIVVDLISPINISYFWNFGSLLGLRLIIQIVRGLLLTIYYSPNVSLAFNCVAYISREVNYGWIIKNFHSNGASIFFLCIYIHIRRGLYYITKKKRKVWITGVTIYILRIATAFIGYLLPWGQIRFWGATVITNIFSAIPYLGESLVIWLWGGFAVNNATLNRFFSFHFILPFIIAFIVIIHLIFLHEEGSRNPLGVNSNYIKTPFHIHFIIKDLKGFIFFFLILEFLVFFYPNLLGERENFIYANSLVTPTHIKPEWYFLWAYSILRSVPNKLGGVVLIIFAIVILYFIPFIWDNLKNNRFNVFFQINFWFFIVFFIILTWIGACPVEYPYDTLGIIMTIIYFSNFLLSILAKKY